jgi:3-deoxy-manno-octulosonate cytidylyltransferase (CMP-KDO synthetase)
MKCIGVIPARFASTRFPGKSLVMIHGKSMIRRVYEQASRAVSLSSLIVATDDPRIENHVKSFGGAVILTSPHHKSGTERCNEAVQRIIEADPANNQYDVVINIQGDEPYINPEQIDQVARCFNDLSVLIATLRKKIVTADDLSDPNVVKVITYTNNNAIYFSRQAIPYIRDVMEDKWISRHDFFKHIGIYGYRTEILGELVRLSPSPLENAEALEQLRWLENGYPIHVRETEYESISVDIPEDLSKFTNKS